MSALLIQTATRRCKTTANLWRLCRWRWFLRQRFIDNITCVHIISKWNCVIIQHSKSIRKYPKVNNLRRWPHDPFGLVKSYKFMSNLFCCLIQRFPSHHTKSGKEEKYHDGRSNYLINQNLFSDNPERSSWHLRVQILIPEMAEHSHRLKVESLF